MKNYMYQIVSKVVVKLGIVVTPAYIAQINPTEVSEWLSIVTSIGVMISGVFEWFQKRKIQKQQLKEQQKQLDNVIDINSKEIIENEQQTIKP